MNHDPETQLRVALLRIAEQLDTWATESKKGGWSVHQVQPQRDLASKIRDALASYRYDVLACKQ